MVKINSKQSKPNIIIIGASGHAKVVIDIIERQREYQILGLIDSYKPKGYKIFEYEVLGTETSIPELMKRDCIQAGIIAIGDNAQRKHMVDTIAKIAPEFKYITAIHPQAVIGKGVSVAEGTVIVAGAIINAGSIIKRHSIINTKASIGHDCILEKFSSVSPGATLGGGVHLNEGAIVGMGATILGKCHIGKYALIGAGALVNKDILEFTVAYGLPAKGVKLRQEKDPYL
jgi:sugar O-acyltransferase (sialic acid O-acetyltransferase NeuD family)